MVGQTKWCAWLAGIIDWMDGWMTPLSYKDRRRPCLTKNTLHFCDFYIAYREELAQTHIYLRRLTFV